MSISLPSGTVTFLFTDLEGSTRLWEQYPGEMKRALARHDEIVRQAIESHGGRVIKSTGDGFHAAFDTGVSGVEAALAAQGALLGADWAEVQPHKLRVRVALHTGEAQERAGDYYGQALNRAARLMSVAHGGQTLVSNTTADLVRDQLPASTSLKDLGEHRLRDLVRSEHIFQLVHPALPADFPPLKSVDAFPNNLPVQLTTFIGREREIEEARQRLLSARLLTMIGPGGTGKTRMSLQLAADLLPSFRDGVWLAEFAPLVDPALVVRTIGSIFNLRDQPGMPLHELVIDYLREKDLLLVLDNCEHLIDASAQLADQLLRACANLKIIASSREALGIAGETIYRVPPLSLPDSEHASRESLAACEAAQLFIERASAANPRFMLTEDNAPAVGQICRRLDGIPLALELAAARVSALSVQQIASHLDDRFRLLTGGSRTALPRQQTLRAMIDWSYELLSAQEQDLLRRLSVFSGGWTFEAAEAVCSDLDVLTLLAQLVNKSMVIVDDEGSERRYRLLETVRQYARDKLLEGGASERVRRAHFEFFLKLAAEAEPKLRTFGASEWMTRLEAEHDNIRAALQWGLEQPGEDILQMVLQMAPLLVYFWNRRGYEEEGRRFIGEALDRAHGRPEPPDEIGRMQRWKSMGEAWQTVAMLAYSQGDNARAVEASDQAAAFARRSGDKRLLALALGFEASGAMYLGRTEGLQEMLEEGIAAAEESGDPVALGLPLGLYAQALVTREGMREAAEVEMERARVLIRQSGDDWVATMAVLTAAMLAKYRRDYVEARKQFLACDPLFRDLGDSHRSNMVKSELAHLDRYEGRYEDAEAAYRLTIREWQRLGHRAAVAHQLESLASIAVAREQGERAARLFGAAEALREKINISMTNLERAEYEDRVNTLRAGMDGKLFESGWAAGRLMSMETAIRFAIGSEPPGEARRA